MTTSPFDEAAPPLRHSVIDDRPDWHAEADQVLAHEMAFRSGEVSHEKEAEDEGRPWLWASAIAVPLLILAVLYLMNVFTI